MGHEVCRTGPNLQSWSLGFGSIMLSFSNSLLAFGIIYCGQPDFQTLGVQAHSSISLVA